MHPPIPTASFVRSLLALGVALAGGAPASADVLLLGSGGAAFETVQAAVDAAAEGGTLLVGEGSYAAFTIDGKGVNVLAAPGASPTILGRVDVRNLAATSSLRFDGLAFEGLPTGGGGTFDFEHQAAVRLESNVGAIRFHRCTLRGGSGEEYSSNNPPPPGIGIVFPDGGPGLDGVDSRDVALLDCALRGGDGSGVAGDPSSNGGFGGHALRGTSSSFALYECDLVGGAGGRGGATGGLGGSGSRVTELGVFASGSSFQGGAGGDADAFVQAQGGDGGTGFWLGLNGHARLVDNVYAGGPGGSALFQPFPFDGADGADRLWLGGVLSDLPGVHRSFTTDRAVFGDGDDAPLRFEGEPGDRVFFAVSQQPAFQFVGNPPGVHLVPEPAYLDWWTSTPTDAQGDADLTLALLEAPPGGERTVTVQAIVRTASGDLWLAGAVLLTGVDDETGADCDGNGQLDLLDVGDGLATDCDGDFVRDDCVVLGDCNGNGVDDGLDLACGGFADLNDNQVLDVCEAGVTIYVDVAAPAGGDGSQASPYRDLAAAFSIAQDGDRIEVAPGTYVGPLNRQLDFAGRDLFVYSTGGSATCTLDLQGAPFAFRAGPGSDSLRIAGFTIESAVNAQNTPERGALRLSATGLALVEDCHVRLCTSNFGPAALQASGNVRVVDCVFADNSATTGEGGAVSATGHFEARGTRFLRNTGREGGALYLAGDRGEHTLVHCLLQDNSANFVGGALRIDDTTVRVDGSLLSTNFASSGGGAIFKSATFPEVADLIVTSSTLVENDTNGGGSCCLSSGEGETVFANSILWVGGASASAALFVSSGFNVAATLVRLEHCDIEGGVAGQALSGTLTIDTVLDVDPLFLNPAIGDYQLGAGSPCVDAGRDDRLAADLLDVDGDGDVLEVVPLDLLGNPRELDDPAVVDTGVGSAPVTDLGVVER